MDFSNKVVIVTGSSSGIGAATVVQFAGLSAKVVLVGRNEKNLKQVGKQCKEQKGIEPLIVTADIAVDDDVKKIIEETLNKFGQIDVLVNNAAVFGVNTLKDGIEPFDEVIKTNLRSVYLLTSLAAPHLKKTKGNIINISSTLSTSVHTIYLPYSISKAALDHFTRCVAKDLASDGVRVNSVNPGPVKTPIFSRTFKDEDQASVFISEMEKSSPLGKVATTEDVANLILFLASDKASSITGSIYVIDNGFLL